MVSLHFSGCLNALTKYTSLACAYYIMRRAFCHNKTDLFCKIPLKRLPALYKKKPPFQAAFSLQLVLDGIKDVLDILLERFNAFAGAHAVGEGVGLGDGIFIGGDGYGLDARIGLHDFI